MSVDSAVIMMARCMVIMHPWGGAMRKATKASTRIQGMRDQIKEFEDHNQELSRQKNGVEEDFSSTKKKLEDFEVGHQATKEKLESAKIYLEVLLMELTTVNVIKKEVEENVMRLQVKVEELKTREEEPKTKNTNLVESSLFDYTEGFKKVMRLTIYFSPNVNPKNFDIDKDVIDGHLVDD